MPFAYNKKFVTNARLLRSNMTEEEKQAWLEAGTIADQIWEAKKRGEYPQTVKESLLEYESKERINRW